MTIEGTLGRMRVGDLHPVRIMAVINLSWESFYKGSFVAPLNVLSRAEALTEEGADMLDLGAVSTAPGSPPIGEDEERQRLIPSLKMVLDNLDIPISVDTQRARIAEEALSMGASCVNDVSGLLDSNMARAIADHDAEAVIMASRNRPGDLMTMKEVVQVLSERIGKAVDVGISPDKIVIDPGVGRWIPEKMPEHDLAILDSLPRLRVLGRPVVVAVSRKSFIGSRLNRPNPEDRLSGSLGATAIAVYNGAHIIRTHDVRATLDVIKMAEAIRGRPAFVERGTLKVEVSYSMGNPDDLKEAFKRIQVGEGGSKAMSGKGAFRMLSLQGVTSKEALIIKQEMLARGGDAAIPMGALRCDPGPMEVLVIGTLAQLNGLINNLKTQPFNLPSIGDAILEAIGQIESTERYR